MKNRKTVVLDNFVNHYDVQVSSIHVHTYQITEK